MVHLAVGSDAIVVHKHQKPHQNLMISKIQQLPVDPEFAPKDLTPENIEYFSKNLVGSGSFG